MTKILSLKLVRCIKVTSYLFDGSKYRDNILLCFLTNLSCSKSAPTVQEEDEDEEEEEGVVAGYGVICGVRAVRSWDADMGSGGRAYIPYYQAFTSCTTLALPYTAMPTSSMGSGANNTAQDLFTGKRRSTVL